MTGKEMGEKMLLAVKAAIDRVASTLRKEWDDRFSELEKRLQEIPAGPQGESGKDGVDGESVTLEEVSPVIVAEIQRRVSEIPPAKDGKDGTPGRDGKDADEDAFRAFIAAEVKMAVESLPVAKDGKDGRDGEDADEALILRTIRDEVKEAVAAIPIPKDGVSGRDGRDGEDGLDAMEIEFLPGIDESKRYPRGTFARHNGGIWRSHETTKGMEGWECLVEGHPTFEVQQSDERTVKFLVKKTGGQVIENVFKFPFILYKEIWREGQYERGDVVTFGGSAWHCQEPTTDKPGTSKAWRLMVKEGRPGKDAGSELNKHVGPVRLK